MYLALDPGLEVVGEAADGREAVALCAETSPDVVLMDLLMPRMDGIAAIRELRARGDGPEVIALTSVLEDGSVGEAVRAGAAGYVLKTTDAQKLLRAITTVAEGRVYLTPEAATRLAGDMRVPSPAGDATGDLTRRQRDVLALLARGHANKRIALELGIAEKTVKAHVSTILAKLGATSRTQAALHALRAGIVTLEDGDGGGR